MFGLVLFFSSDIWILIFFPLNSFSLAFIPESILAFFISFHPICRRAFTFQLAQKKTMHTNIPFSMQIQFHLANGNWANEFRIKVGKRTVKMWTKSNRQDHSKKMINELRQMKLSVKNRNYGSNWDTFEISIRNWTNAVSNRFISNKWESKQNAKLVLATIHFEWEWNWWK